MFLINLYRITKTGLIGFWRNRWIGQATIGVMTLTLFLVVSLITIRAVTVHLLSELEQKIDVSVYFTLDTKEADILAAKESIETLPEVKKVTYISRQKALVKFKENYKDNPVILQSLEELDSNPLTASLNIQANNPEQLASVASFIQNNYDALIDKLSYEENADIIDRLAAFSANVQRGGLILGLILVIIVTLVTFTTIKLTIYSLRSEISIMRLIGASNWYIRGPFLIEGVLYGTIAALATSSVSLLLARLISDRLVGVLLGFNLFNFLVENLVSLFLLELVIAVGLGIFSSWVAMRNYLKV